MTIDDIDDIPQPSCPPGSIRPDYSTHSLLVLARRLGLREPQVAELFAWLDGVSTRTLALRSATSQAATWRRLQRIKARLAPHVSEDGIVSEHVPLHGLDDLIYDLFWVRSNWLG